MKQSGKMKIGYFIDTFFPMIDGVVMAVDHYARGAAAFADVTVFAPDCGDYDFGALPYEVALCKSLPLPRSDYRLPLSTADSAFRKKLDASRLDLVHIHSPAFVGKAGMRYAKRHGIPAVATLHSQFKTDYLRALKSEALANCLVRDLTALYDRADACWTVNDATARLYTEVYGGKSRPVVIGNATDLVPCPDPEASRRRVDAQYRLRDGETVLLYVGRIDALKNVLMIAEAMKFLKDGGNFPFKMLFAGGGRQEADLKQAIERLGLEDDVVLCGTIRDRARLAELYARADLFVFPSLYDTNSLVQIEAASQSTPALFIRGSVTSATVTENVNGFCCDHSAEALARKIVEIFENRPLYEAVCRGAYRDLYRTWDVTVAEARARYSALIAASGRERTGTAREAGMLPQRR